jgi:hypothetical protein
MYGVKMELCFSYRNLGRICQSILKWVLKKQPGRKWTRLIWLLQGPMAGHYEQCKEYSDHAKGSYLLKACYAPLLYTALWRDQRYWVQANLKSFSLFSWTCGRDQYLSWRILPCSSKFQVLRCGGAWSLIGGGGVTATRTSTGVSMVISVS